MSTLILTMAGKYTRFRNEGYRLPKYLLPWGSRTILSEILYQMLGSGAFESVFLVANLADIDYMGHVRGIMRYHGIDAANLILTPDTKGQAETASIGLKQAITTGHVRGPVVFHNIDTILYGRDFDRMNRLLETNSGYVDVFRSNSHDYSYVLAPNGRVEAIGEKILISSLATSGLYGFASPQVFEDSYTGQGYISDVYATMLSGGQSIVIGDTHSEADTVVLGTPEEYLRGSRLMKTV